MLSDSCSEEACKRNLCLFLIHCSSRSLVQTCRRLRRGLANTQIEARRIVARACAQCESEALGGNLGGSVSAKTHFDAICRNPTVWIDDGVVVKDGRVDTGR